MESQIKIYHENYMKLPKRFIDKIETDIENILNANLQGLKAIYLFGSCARGDLRSSSDIDLLILTKKKLKDRFLVSNLRYTLEEDRCGVKTDVVFMNEESIKEETVFKNVVNRDKKILLEVIE